MCPYPGASAIEVEEGIVVKIEESLRGMEGIEKITSTSADNWGSVNVEISDGYDMNKAIQEIKETLLMLLIPIRLGQKNLLFLNNQCGTVV